MATTPKGYASVAETQFAVDFLQKLGLTDLSNAYLISAVIAWMRQESGGLSKVIGNNPFNIRTSSYASGYRQTATNGKFAVFSSLKMGAYAAAQLLLQAGHDYRDYWRIVAAAKRGGGATDATKQTQALDFLAAIALSKWDASHYGTGANVTVATYDPSLNHLLSVWATITGIPALPAEPVPATPKAPPKPVAPRALNPPSPPNLVYIDPHGAEAFYSASHRASDLGNLPPA